MHETYKEVMVSIRKQIGTEVTISSNLTKQMAKCDNPN